MLCIDWNGFVLIHRSKLIEGCCHIAFAFPSEGYPLDRHVGEGACIETTGDRISTRATEICETRDDTQKKAEMQPEG